MNHVDFKKHPVSCHFFFLMSHIACEFKEMAMSNLGVKSHTYFHNGDFADLILLSPSEIKQELCKLMISITQ